MLFAHWHSISELYFIIIPSFLVALLSPVKTIPFPKSSDSPVKNPISIVPPSDVSFASYIISSPFFLMPISVPNVAFNPCSPSLDFPIPKKYSEFDISYFSGAFISTALYIPSGKSAVNSP